MHKGKRSLVVLMAMLLIALASCATEKPAPVPEPQPEVTTTTTVPAPVPEVVTETTIAPVVTGTTTVAQPSVSEIELRNLFGQANALKTEAVQNDVARVLPDEFGAADAEFATAKAAYDSTMDEVSFDGAKAYPIKGRLEKSIASWESLLAEGMPLRVEEESDKATDMKFAAVAAEAPELASERYEGAEGLFADAEALAESGEYAVAIPAFQQAAAAYDVSAEQAKANTLRSKIFANGYAKYAESNFQMGEQKFNDEKALWEGGSLEDLEAGADTLREANSYYEFVISSGAEYKSFEGKDRAVQAQGKALSANADVNAPEEYASATDIMNEALANQEKGAYESAYLWFGDAAEAYGGAYDAAFALKGGSEEALAAAETAVAASEQKSEEAGVEKNVYLAEAQYNLERAKIQNDNQLYSDAAVSANEAVNYAGMSDRYVDGEMQKKADAEAKTLAADKASADTAMTAARTRMAWAENNNIKADYPAKYKDASAAMEGAEIAYANERYAPAKDLAGEVSTTLSDSFQKGVLANRQEAQQKAADKAAADAAMADAQNRMAWANENGIKENYPEEYKGASSAMVASFVSYGNEDYGTATTKAEEVSSILSDDFQDKVAADKKASSEEQARLDAEKRAADAAMADARTRMAWAESNNIKADYPAKYKDASAAMKGAEIAYANERYAPAKDLAEEVSVTLSDDFQKDVPAERQAAKEKAANKASADAAMADARTRMAWAESNNIKADYPAKYKDASAAMKGAEIAYANERYAPAKDLAKEVSVTLSDDFQKKVFADRAVKPEPTPAPAPKPAPQPAEVVKPVPDAETAATEAVEKQPAAEVEQGPTAEELATAKAEAQTDIDNAQAKYGWAVSKNAANNYPELLAKGGEELDGAKAAFASENYTGASTRAKAALDTLSGIEEFAPLPAVYVVRLIPARRDCLWRIAEYPFIYNNPLKWPVLYEANKKTFRDPSNPDLIFPNQVLKVPSIKDETRSGTWDPKKTYNPLPKK